MEAFALESHRRARVAQKEGRFDREIIETEGLKMDETVRDTSIEQMAKLETLTPGGTITDGVSSQTGDVPSAMLIGSEQAVTEYGPTARNPIHPLTVNSENPLCIQTPHIPPTNHHLHTPN